MFDNLRPDSTRGIRQRAKKHAEQPRTIDNMSREKHEKNYQNLILIAEAIILVCTLCVTVFASAFYSLDAAICDKLYTNFRGVSNDIRIIAIDEETLEAYGNFANWSRQKTADLLQLLCADQENEPAVIGVDILFTGESDARADARLAEAAEKACPIVLASNLVYRGSTKQNREGELYYDTMHVDMVEEPYAALRKAGRMGYTNAFVAADGRIRYTKLFEDHNTNAESFAWSLYEIYENARGRQPALPPTNDAGQLHFFYSGQVGEFSHVSLKSVLDGTVPASEFKDCIVLLGPYAPGFQDAYASAAERGNPMYGVEIQANIIQALMDGKTALAVPAWMYLAVVCPLLLIFFFLAQRQKLLPTLLTCLTLLALHMLVGRRLAAEGYTITQAYFALLILLLIGYFIVKKYLIEQYKRKKMLSAFKKYVAPQVVDELEKEGNFDLKLGGEKRKVAVLFVDIRGFTPLSESLEPEQVVSILNQYLDLTSTSILNNYGMLDKFIGDATMAVFNAPFDLDDYIYKAVKAAADMRAGADVLSRKLAEQFGRSVSFGIGVNCGEAVVGNIGSEFRMDYTAIGDTVNTAARLESRAAAGEILISKAVHDALEGRITTEEVGQMELKGKAKAVTVYRVLEIE